MKNVIIRGKRKQKLILSISVELSWVTDEEEDQVKYHVKRRVNTSTLLQLAVDVAYFLVHLHHHISLT